MSVGVHFEGVDFSLIALSVLPLIESGTLFAGSTGNQDKDVSH
jgi:hypothetical protein